MFLASDPPETKPPACSWSPHWEQIAGDVRTRAGGSSAGPDTPPRKRKGRIERIRPDPGERFSIEGPWEVEAVLSEKGKILDARVMKGASTPPWPKYEAHILKSLRKWEFEPARLKGVPVGTCVVFELQDK